MAEHEIRQRDQLCMGTVITHRVCGDHSEKVLEEAEQEVNRLNRLLSRFVAESEISQISDAAGRKPIPVSKSTYELFQVALEYSEISHGLFDVTIGPLVELWDQEKRELSVPAREEIETCLALVDYHCVICDDCSQSVGLERERQSVDFGGIGKGFAADQVLDRFRNQGVESGFTNFGGNVALLGSKLDGSCWRVGVQHPRENGQLIGFLDLIDRSVATSGDYQRYYQAKNGRFYHHIINPTTGYPSDSGLISATIITKSATKADALSTIFFSSGMAGCRYLLRLLPEVETVLIDKDLNVYISTGLEGNFRAIEGINVYTLDPISKKEAGLYG